LALGLTVWSSSALCQAPEPADPDEHQVFSVMIGASTVRMGLVSAMDRMDGAHADQATLPLRTCMRRLEFEASEIVRLEQSIWESIGIRDQMKEPSDRDDMGETVRKSSNQISGLLKTSKTMDFDKTYRKCSTYSEFKENASKVAGLFDQAQAMLAKLQAPAS
jgi:hypothetical protein